MKHSWLERADGTARCRRCPAERVQATRSQQIGVGVDADGFSFSVTKSTAVVLVLDGHLTKCAGGEVRR